VQPRALGRKASDEYAVPLCRTHHRAVHRTGDEQAWWEQAGIDPVDLCRAVTDGSITVFTAPAGPFNSLWLSLASLACDAAALLLELTLDGQLALECDRHHIFALFLRDRAGESPPDPFWPFRDWVLGAHVTRTGVETLTFRQIQLD
jgi:hypothetical protein